MAIYTFSQLTNNQAIEFDPANDILLFDGGLSATDVDFEFLDSGRGWLFSVNSPSGLAGWELTKTVSLLMTPGSDPANAYKLSSSNIQFANGSLFLWGDDTSGTANDETTTQTLDGGAGNDVLVSFGGSQTLNGGDGNDYLVSAPHVVGSTGGTGTDVFNRLLKNPAKFMHMV